MTEPSKEALEAAIFYRLAKDQDDLRSAALALDAFAQQARDQAKEDCDEQCFALGEEIEALRNDLEQARDQALEEAALIVEKWDPISDRWADMPCLPIGIKRRMLQQLRALKSTASGNRK